MSNAEVFGKGWRETVELTPRGLVHRPAANPGWVARYRMTQAQRQRLLQLTDEAERLADRLRYRAVRTRVYDPRLVALCGRAEVRLIRRIWIGRQPTYLVEE